MKFLLFVTLFIIGILTECSSQDPKPQVGSLNDPTWHLVFRDEFDYKDRFPTYSKAQLIDRMTNGAYAPQSAPTMPYPYPYVAAAYPYPNNSNWNIGEAGTKFDTTAVFHSYRSDADGEQITFNWGYITLSVARTFGATRVYPCNTCDNNWDTKARHITDAVMASMTSFYQYKYGTYEIKFRLPPINYKGTIPGTSVNNRETVRGYSSNFWLFPDYPPVDSTHMYCELDFFETESGNNNILGTTPHLTPYGAMPNNNGFDPQRGPWKYLEPDNIPDTHTPWPDFSDSNWHVYTCEWTPEYITVFIDGETIFSYGISTEKADLEIQKMNMIVGPGCPWGDPKDHQYAGHSFPGPYSLTSYYMDVDYIRVWELNDDIGNNVTYLNYTDLSSYDNKVKKNITVSGTGQTVTLPSGNTKIVLRAKEGVNLLEGFDTGTNEDFYVQAQTLDF